MIKPKVSILIPVYNRVDMIKDCVDSALSQDYPNTEVIISDNCSTDGTWELCCRLYADHPKVNLYRSISNLGRFQTGWLLLVQLVAYMQKYYLVMIFFLRVVFVIWLLS